MSAQSHKGTQTSQKLFCEDDESSMDSGTACGFEEDACAAMASGTVCRCGDGGSGARETAKMAAGADGRRSNPRSNLAFL